MIELVVLGATLALAAGASGAQARRRVLASRALQRYASWRKHQFVPATRTSRSPRVEGTKDDVSFTIDLLKVSGHIRTRVCAPVTKGPGAKIAIAQRSSIARALGTETPGAGPVGIPAFDAAYQLHGMAPDDARAWLEETMEDLVCLDERSHVWLGSDGAKVTLMWGGIEMNPLLLDSARDVVVSLAAWHRPDFPYR